MSRAKRDPEKDAFWRLVVDEYQRSGLSVRAFCRQEGLSEASFHYWKRILAERDREAKTLGEDRTAVRASRSRLGKRQAPRNRKKQPSAGSNSFVPIEVVASPIASSWELTVETPSGYTISLPPTVDIAQFGQVLEVLASQSPRSKTSVKRDAS